MKIAQTLLMLLISNSFMTYAWYGHLKDHKEDPLWYVIVLSCAIAFFEYCWQVPANRIGSGVLNVPQLKVLQEVLALIVFAIFYLVYMKGKLGWNFGAAGLCLIGAVFFIFREI